MENNDAERHLGGDGGLVVSSNLQGIGLGL